jgi:large subunit ribosomal protein L10
MPRAEKEAKVKEISVRLTESQAAVLTGYRGLTVAEAAELREALGDVDTRFSIVKNSLTALAIKDAGLEGLAEMIDGPTAIAFVQGDPVAGAKRLVEQARRFPVLEVRGGFAEGRILTADDIKTLAALESREALLATVAGLGKMQMARAAWLFQALQSRFLSLMEALKEKLPAEGAEMEAPAPAAEDTPDPDRPGGEEPRESPGQEPAETETGETEPAAPGEPAQEETQEEGGT